MKKFVKIRSEQRDFFLGIFLRYFDEQKNKWVFKVNYKRLVLLFLCLFVLLWLASATTVYCGLKYLRKYDEISFVDVLKNPFSTSKFRIQMGESQIAKSKECFKKGDLQAGYLNLLYGVSRSPDNFEARIMLATIQFNLLSDRNAASKTLEARIAKAFANKDSLYIALAITYMALDNDYRDKSIKLVASVANNNIISDKLLIDAVIKALNILKNEKQNNEFIYYCTKIVDSTNNVLIKKTLAQNGALLLASISKSDEALALLNRANISSGEIYVFAKIMNLVAEENEVFALRLLKATLKNAKQKNIFYDTYATLADDFGDDKGKEEAKNIVRIISNATKNHILSKLESSDSKATVELIKELTKDNPQEIFNLAKIVCESKNIDAINYCLTTKLPPHTKIMLQLAKAEYLIIVQKPQDAAICLDSIRFDDYVKTKKLSELFTGFDIVIKALSNGNVSKQLLDFSKNKSPSQSLALSRLLNNANLKKEAFILLKSAIEKYPKNINIASDFSETAFDTNNVSAIIEAYKKYSLRIPIKISAKLKTLLQSDRFMFKDSATISTLIKKSEESQNKIKEYKKIFGNF